MRDDLVGYLLDVLEPSERESLEAQLQRDPQLQHDLDTLRHGLRLLECDREHLDPPQRLAERTCQFVSGQVSTMVAPPAPITRWRLADFVVAAGIFLAASALFFPAVSQSRFAARLSGCQNNLKQLGQALASYSSAHNGQFPDLRSEGPHAAAGIYAAKLLDDGYLTEPSYLICPASSLADQPEHFRVPTLSEIAAASQAQLTEYHRSMGGSYGYNLGYVSEGKYQPTINRGRSTFAIMADAPSDQAEERASLNHGGSGQNVLFEDGHVEFLVNCNREGCPDNIFLNDQGQAAAGMHEDDAVIGSSPMRPLLVPVSSSGR